MSENLTIEVSSSYIQKRGILHFLPQTRLFFPWGDRIKQFILEGRERAHLIGNKSYIAL